MVASPVIQAIRRSSSQRGRCRDPPSRCFKAGNMKAADNGPKTDGGQKKPAERRSARDLIARDERKVGPVGAGKNEERKGTDQGRSQMPVVAHMQARRGSPAGFYLSEGY
jgi:hypothetical protein